MWTGNGILRPEANMSSLEPPADEAEQPVTVVIADEYPITRQGTRQIFEADPFITVIGEAADGAELVMLV